MARKKEIIVRYGMVAQLSRDCGVHRETVRLALKGFTESTQADLIRKRAKEAPYYGVEVKY